MPWAQHSLTYQGTQLLIEEETKLRAASERLENIEQEIAKGEERIKRQAILVGSMKRNAPDESEPCEATDSHRRRGKI